MRNRAAHRWLVKPWFAALLLTAFMSRALRPVGFMPGPGGLILCSGYASAPLTGDSRDASHDMPGMDMGGMDMPGQAKQAGQGGHSPEHESMGVCPYAAAASVLALTHAAAPSALLRIVSTAIIAASSAIAPRRAAVPTSLPRGPPAYLA